VLVLFILGLVALERSTSFVGEIQANIGGATDVSLIRTLRAHRVAVESLAASDDGQILASAGSDGQIVVWDQATGDELRAIVSPGSDFTALATSEHVLLGGRNDGTIGLWQLDSGEKIAEFHDQDGPVWSLTFLGSSRTFASSGQDAKVRIWDTTRSIRSVLSDHRKPVLAIAYAQKQRLIISAGADKTIKLWDERRRRLLRTYAEQAETIRALAFSPDGETFASGGDDKTISLWSTASDGKIKALEGHGNRVVALAFSPNGRMLVSGSEDGTVKLWDVGSGQLLATFEGHVRPVRAVAFLPDGHRIASAGDDMTVRLWNARIAGFP
jgi:WD40 repeat protein